MQKKLSSNLGPFLLVIDSFLACDSEQQKRSQNTETFTNCNDLLVHKPLYQPKPAPSYKPADAYQPAPAYKPAPSYKPVPVYKPAPVYTPAPTYKPAATTEKHTTQHEYKSIFREHIGNRKFHKKEKEDSMADE